MVLPRRPDGTGGASGAEPAALVTREGLIGTAAA
jgi:nitrile hydratase